MAGTIGVGSALRRARELRGITVDEACATRGSAPPQIAALEAEAFDDLGGEVYARAMLRTYAQYLGLDAAKVMRVYARVAESRRAAAAAGEDGARRAGDGRGADPRQPALPADRRGGRPGGARGGGARVARRRGAGGGRHPAVSRTASFAETTTRADGRRRAHAPAPRSTSTAVIDGVPEEPVSLRPGEIALVPGGAGGHRDRRATAGAVGVAVNGRGPRLAWVGREALDETYVEPSAEAP